MFSHCQTQEFLILSSVFSKGVAGKTAVMVEDVTSQSGRLLPKSLRGRPRKVCLSFSLASHSVLMQNASAPIYSPMRLCPLKHPFPHMAIRAFTFMVVSTMTPGRGEGGIPHHPVSFQSGEERDLRIQECVMAQAQNPTSQKRLYGKMVGTVVEPWRLRSAL